MKKLETPTNRLIENYVNKFNIDKRYKTADISINNLIKVFPENKKLEDIYLKVTVINRLYSTNILGIWEMSNHILNIQVDEAINNGNPSIVHHIALGHGVKLKNKTENDKVIKDINFYSFATKYCNWHNQECYPIYDSFVEKILIEYQKDKPFSIFNTIDLKDFIKFKTIISDFINYYNLNNKSLKEIDKFLWIYGREREIERKGKDRY